MVKEIINTLTIKGKRSLILSTFYFTIYALASIVMMVLVINVLNELSHSKDVSLMPYFIALIICLIIKGVSNILADAHKHYAGFDIVYELKENIIYKLKSFSLGFYTNERLGEISSIIHKDVDNMELVVGHMWPRMISSFIVSTLLIVYLFSRSWLLGLLMISIIPFALWYLLSGIKKASELEENTGNHLADMVSLFVEYVKGLPLLKAFSESKKFDDTLKTATTQFGKSNMHTAGYRAKVLSIYGFLIDFSFWIMITVGAFFVLNNKVSVIAYVIYIVIGKEFYKPFMSMEKHWIDYVKVTDSFKRIKKITKAPVVEEPVHPQNTTTFDITFDKVGFFYEEGEFEMKSTSFHVPQNTLTALVGESGSGKTTITNLLLRFWDVNKGSIRIGDLDIRDISYDDLLGNISIVMQNVKLFADTVEGNIRIGKNNATKQEVIAAAKKARIHDFIMTLPNGYDTIIGENGVGLSGGQKQRLSIARAFLKDAPILLLDEITSNVDPINESIIQEAISELANNRTVLVIAHHLSTIKSADQILVFRKGELIQTGKHKELLKHKNSYYYTLWHKKIHNATIEEKGA